MHVTACLAYEHPLNILSCIYVEYDTMDIPMLNEVIQMLRQQLEKAQVDRNYVQHERVRPLLINCLFCHINHYMNV